MSHCCTPPIPASSQPDVAPQRGAEPARRRFARGAPWMVLPLMVLLMVGLRFALQWSWPLPVCWLRKLTGIPCPACGCTRSLAAWAQLDPMAAFRFNPLCAVLCLALAAWAGLWLIERAGGQSWLQEWGVRARRWRLGRILCVLAFLNWLYLCLWLPK